MLNASEIVLDFFFLPDYTHAFIFRCATGSESLSRRSRAVTTSLSSSCCSCWAVSAFTRSVIRAMTPREERRIKRPSRHQEPIGRSIIRRSSERRIYRSRSNGWRGCDSNPLSLGLTPSPLSSLPRRVPPPPFAPTLRFHRNSPPHCCSNVLSDPLYLTFPIFLNSRKIIIRRVPHRLRLSVTFLSLFFFSARDEISN